MFLLGAISPDLQRFPNAKYRQPKRSNALPSTCTSSVAPRAPRLFLELPEILFLLFRYSFIFCCFGSGGHLFELCCELEEWCGGGWRERTAIGWKPQLTSEVTSPCLLPCADRVEEKGESGGGVARIFEE